MSEPSVIVFPQVSEVAINTDCPTLARLKTEVCTNAELQAALVRVIELHNKLAADLDRLGHLRIPATYEFNM